VFARALALALLWVAAATAQVPVPALGARVTDLTSTLASDQRGALEAKLAAFERAKGSQVVVLIVPTTQPEEIEQFGIRVADAWKIGRGGKIDDGVILLVAKEDRRVRIEVGYGLEGALPDAIAKRIIEEEIVPRFRAGDFYGGIDAGVSRIVAVIEGEPMPPPSRGTRDGPVQFPPNALWMLVVAPLAVGALVRAAVNRFVGAAAAGALATGITWWIVGAANAALGLGAFCFLFVLLTGISGARPGAWSSGRGGGGGWGGGGFGGGGFGGGGGFSGGGGGFGGGGASGRW
jgi:uncharacterized protein